MDVNGSRPSTKPLENHNLVSTRAEERRGSPLKRLVQLGKGRRLMGLTQSLTDRNWKTK